ncbi:MAG: choice-of-anchor L domain-containing protein [Planktotalea sp.]|uniref:Hint domain-containing protein n=1 Tax=Planktotalea sp. TaxID=2029877 RepID=UPI0026162D38|nr:Hint domain-containing protein [Planktotalea sp.]MDG1084381.1 choice-of-anchor L domain-containing protein [Planktotalea sp.]
MPATGAELGYNTSASALAMANAIFGSGVTVTGASYSGDNRSSAIYSNGDALSPDATPGDTGVILSTGRADRFTQSNGDPNRVTNTSTNTSGVNNDSDFNAAAGANTYDASFLEVDFTSPTAGFMTMQFVFASEEYPEYVNSLFQDMVGVWINGSQVNLTVGNGDADPGNLNASDNSNLFINNTSDDYNTEMDGFTVTMTMTIPINSGTNSIKIGVADVADSSYDSNLLIAADSIQSALLANDDSANINPTGSKTINVLANDTNTTGGTLTVTHINGQSVVVGSIITLGTGQTVELNADGTLTVVGDGDVEDVNFTYAIESSMGESDTGFVLLNMVPCFVAGTLIETAHGKMPVEVLEVGDLILTRDQGYQPLRWIGQRDVVATGKMAPVEIAANTFGEHGVLRVSPLHRILLQDELAELLFGESEVLVAAKELVNDQTVRIREGGDVTYVHLLFDHHQIVISNGLESESFLPGGQITNLFEEEAVAEICAIFPELDPHTGEGYSPAARRILRKYEADLLLGRAA